MQKALFPMTTLRITQDENGATSHKGSLAMDLGGKDTGSDKIYAPCDLSVVRIRTNSSHETYLESAEPVLWADGTVDYMSFTMMHDNYINSNCKVGSIIPQGAYFMDEGGFGGGKVNKFGTHCHLEVSKGKSTKSQFKNSYGTWQTANQVHIYNALFVSADCTISNKGYETRHNWKSTDDKLLDTSNNSKLESTVTESVSSSYLVKANYNIYMHKTADDYLWTRNGKKATKGYNYRIYEVKNKWGRTSWGWINLSYTSKV